MRKRRSPAATWRSPIISPRGGTRYHWHQHRGRRRRIGRHYRRDALSRRCNGSPSSCSPGPPARDHCLGAAAAGAVSAGTPILTPTAPGGVPIDKLLHPATSARSFEPDGSIHTTTVRAIVSLRVEDYRILQVGATTLYVTADHPFCTAPGTFQAAGSLHIGQRCWRASMGGWCPAGVERLAAVHGPLEVFNLQVDHAAHFFAAALAVHNKGGGCFCHWHACGYAGRPEAHRAALPRRQSPGLRPRRSASAVTTTTIRTIVSLGSGPARCD